MPRKKGAMLSRVWRSLTANRSKAVWFVALRRATTREKIWGRKRHLLVDTQVHVLAIKVLGADGSAQQEAKELLEPLKAPFPSIKLV